MIDTCDPSIASWYVDVLDLKVIKVCSSDFLGSGWSIKLCVTLNSDPKTLMWSPTSSKEVCPNKQNTHAV
jgi:hypothetical protein